MSNVNKKPGNLSARINVRGVPSGRSGRTDAKSAGNDMNRGEKVTVSFSKASNTK